MKFPKDKTCLQLINMLMQMIFVFFDIFFSIYIYGISQNLNFVLGYNLFDCIFYMFLEFLFIKFLNKKNFNIVYRLSFVMSLVSISLVFTINSSRLYMVFIVQAIYAFARGCYYVPHEIATMNYNTKKTMVSFLGVSQFLSLFASVLSPFISGYIIDYVSYYILFAVILVIAFVCFLLSFEVKKGWVEAPQIKIRDFIKGTHKIKRVRMTYLALGLYKFSQNSVVDLLLPILLFMRVGTNFSVGLYSALAVVASGIVLIIYLKLYKFKDPLLMISTILIVAVSIMLTAWTSIVGFFIYYFVLKCCRKIISHRTAQDIYTAIENTEFSQYKKEHHLTFNYYDHIFKTFAYLIAFFIYNVIPNEISLSIIILTLSLIQIISSSLFIKAEKIYNNEIKEKEEGLETNESSLKI